MPTKSKPTKASSSMPRCDRKRCKNEATMFPIMVVPAPDWAKNANAKVEMEMSLNVCPVHAVEDISQFMDDSNYAQIVQAFAVRRLPPPERKTMYVIFRQLEDRKVMP